MIHMGLDFETYGAVSLPDHGLDRYVSDETFTPLIAHTYSESFSWSAPGEAFDFVLGDKILETQRLGQLLAREDVIIDAHNAGFERAVLHQMGIVLPADRFHDSAVTARAMGAGSSLEAAAPQLLGCDKVELGKDLIKLFSIPGEYQEKYGTLHFVPDVVFDNPVKWDDFKHYCYTDAMLSHNINSRSEYAVPYKEWSYAAITLEMNSLGWPVDLDLVEEMQRRYLDNQEVALKVFRDACDAKDLNLSSFQQLKKWCLDRGVRARSFDEKSVASILAKLEKKLQDSSLPRDKRDNYNEVLHLMQTKQVLGGSSLKKLKTILDTAHNGRLKDQYLHVGAGQTWRTTGRSVQMQNLKRLGEPADMSLLKQEQVHWTNNEMAENLRQVFTASRPQGALIVGDFSSVESRGLAWLAGEQWKLDSYADDQDMYKVLASKIFTKDYLQIDKSERQVGKVGELSCGYGAGAQAVVSFADGMGLTMSEGEAARLVQDWRDANPAIVELWGWLNSALHDAVELDSFSRKPLKDGFELIIQRTGTPLSLLKQHPGSHSVKMSLLCGDTLFMVRYFHGCYIRGGNVHYYKPSSRKGGDLWSPTYTNPKTKQVEPHKIYGGKMAGILTQSVCREIFMGVLQKVYEMTASRSNVDLIGQFHDEIVLDWWPGETSLEEAVQDLKVLMEEPGVFASFPMAAEIKHDYRYTK